MILFSLRCGRTFPPVRHPATPEAACLKQPTLTNPVAAVHPVVRHRHAVSVFPVRTTLELLPASLSPWKQWVNPIDVIENRFSL